MAIVSRFICLCKRQLLQNVKENLLNFNLEDTNGEIKAKITGVREIEYEVDSQKDKFIIGTIHNKIPFVKDDFYVKDNKLIETKRTILQAVRLFFVIDLKTGLIIFSNTHYGEEFGMSILSQAIYGEDKQIENVLFDISKIEEAVFSGKIHSVWLHNYKRKGNIRKRQESGEDIQDDTEYKDCKKVSKSRMGISLTINGKSEKVLVSTKGSILYYREWPDPNKNINYAFELINELLPYSVKQLTL